MLSLFVLVLVSSIILFLSIVVGYVGWHLLYLVFGMTMWLSVLLFLFAAAFTFLLLIGAVSRFIEVRAEHQAKLRDTSESDLLELLNGLHGQSHNLPDNVEYRDGYTDALIDVKNNIKTKRGN